jgi:hypothetical protein
MLFVVLPALDFVTNVWPLHVGDLQWRYGTVGLLSGFLLTPLLGVLLATLVAAVLRHALLQRLLAVLDLVAAALLLLGCALFLLDALQYRGNVPAEAKATFDVGTGKALLKHFTGAGVLAWLGVVGWKAARAARLGQARDTAAPLLVRPESPPKG